MKRYEKPTAAQQLYLLTGPEPHSIRYLLLSLSSTVHLDDGPPIIGETNIGDFATGLTE
jgi:hypothetical protein